MNEAWENQNIEDQIVAAELGGTISDAVVWSDGALPTARLSEFAASVRAGLSSPRKFLSSMYLYDSIGSILFEAICQLREYKCTVGEKRNLRRIGSQLCDAVPGLGRIIELGGGSGEKAAILLASVHNRMGNEIVFHNIDISAKALEFSQATIAGLPGVTFVPHRNDFENGLAEALSMRKGSEQVVVLFLGSSIGNFDREKATSLLKAIRNMLRPGDHLLLGTDLVKDRERLVNAYDDPQGVTAAFNMNILARINFELGANFNLRQFRHEARWVTQGDKRVEMHLVSTTSQRVHIPGAGLTIDFNRGESILTEKSHKYTADEIAQWAAEVGFSLTQQWIDDQSLFADNLLKAT